MVINGAAVSRTAIDAHPVLGTLTSAQRDAIEALLCTHALDTGYVHGSSTKSLTVDITSH